MADRPLVSILTPSFNQARWLSDNLDSVARQTYADIEHVVMDGGSTDGTVELLRSAGDRVVWRSEPDEGQSDALNKAFAASSGEIVGWINSDDGYFEPTAVEEAVAYFERHPDVDLVYSHSAYVNAHGKVLHMIWTPWYIDSWFTREDFISQPTVFIRRGALRDGFVDRSFHFTMDYELFLRMRSKGSRFARIDSVFAFERVQPSRKSMTIRDVHDADVKRLQETYGLPPRTALTGIVMRILAVKARFLGVRLVGRAMGALAYDAPASTYREILRRQVAERRSRMDIGE